MRENTLECIGNCLRVLQKSHVMYRGYGLDEVDGALSPTRRNVLVQLSTYYPDVSLNNLTITEFNEKGQKYYKDLRLRCQEKHGISGCLCPAF